MSENDPSSNPLPASPVASRPPPPTAPERSIGRWGSFAIGLLGLLAYANTFEASWAFDDGVNILRNPFLRWTELSFDNLWRAATRGINDRPVADVTFALNYYLHGFTVPGFHAVNIAIHIANGLLVQALARITFHRVRQSRRQWQAPLATTRLEWAALFAGLLFTLHPIQTQSVTYIVQRMNSMATLFYLAAMLLYLHGRFSETRRRRVAAFSAALASGLLAAGSKENALTLPIAIWLYELFFFRDLNRSWALRAGAWIATPMLLIGGIAFYIVVYGPDMGYASRSFGMGERVLTQLRVLVFYLSLMALPLPSRLNIAHDFPVSQSFLDPATTLASGLLLGALLAAGIGMAPRARIASFAVLWFFLNLVMESSILPLEIVYEHRTYLPMAAVCIALSHAAFTLIPLPTLRLVGISAALVAALGCATFVRNATWIDGITLWSDAYSKSPNALRAVHNLGAALGRAGRNDEAIVLYEKSIQIDPAQADPYQNLGASMLELGDYERALEYMRQAVRLEPDNHLALGGLGDALSELDRLEEAATAYVASLEHYPDERVFTSLGVLRHKQGRFNEAIQLFNTALRYNPEYGLALINMGLVYIDKGELDRALQHFLLVLKTYDEPETHVHIGNVYWEQGRSGAAIHHLQEAVRLAPHSPIAANNLGWMLATAPIDSLRDPVRAIELADRVTEMTGVRDPNVLDTNAAALAALGDFESALAAANDSIAAARELGNLSLALEVNERRALYASGVAYVDRLERAVP